VGLGLVSGATVFKQKSRVAGRWFGAWGADDRQTITAGAHRDAGAIDKAGCVGPAWRKREASEHPRQSVRVARHADIHDRNVQGSPAPARAVMAWAVGSSIGPAGSGLAGGPNVASVGESANMTRRLRDCERRPGRTFAAQAERRGWSAAPRTRMA